VSKRRPPEAEPKGKDQGTLSILPMQLQVGDRFTDETGEWEVVIHPYTTGGGKVVHARVQKVGEPTVTEERAWRAHREGSREARLTEGRAMMLAVFLILLCGLIALVYLISVRRGIPPERVELQRGKDQRYLRDEPPPHN